VGAAGSVGTEIAAGAFDCTFADRCSVAGSAARGSCASGSDSGFGCEFGFDFDFDSGSGFAANSYYAAVVSGHAGCAAPSTAYVQTASPSTPRMVALAVAALALAAAACAIGRSAEEALLIALAAAAAVADLEPVPHCSPSETAPVDSASPEAFLLRLSVPV